MNEPTLMDAIRTLDERKVALGFGIPRGGMTNMRLGDTDDPDSDPRPDGRALLVGLDLNPDELVDTALRVGTAATPGVIIVGPAAALGGIWADGVLTGLLLAELRARHEAARGT